MYTSAAIEQCKGSAQSLPAGNLHYLYEISVMKNLVMMEINSWQWSIGF